MTIDAETAGRAFADTWEILLGSTPGWWAERRRGVVAGITRVGLPTLNGVWAHEPDPDADAIDELLARVGETGLPYCLQAPPEAKVAPQLAAGRGLHREGDVPLMVLDDAGQAVYSAPPELRIRELTTTDLEVHANLAAAGFGVTAEYFRALVTPELAGLPGMRTYIGEVNGEAVTTSVGFTHRDQVAVFNVATPPAHRGRGYGTAATMSAVRDGLNDGAGWSWLQASPVGRPVYERLGFRTVSSWGCWISGAQ